MGKEKTLIRLGTQIDTLRAHINRLKKTGYKVHSLDVDMLRNKTIEFYEMIFELEELYDHEDGNRIEKPKPVIKTVEKEISEDKSEDKPINKPETKPQEIPMSKPLSRLEDKSEDKPEGKPEKKQEVVENTKTNEEHGIVSNGNSNIDFEPAETKPVPEPATTKAPEPVEQVATKPATSEIIKEKESVIAELDQEEPVTTKPGPAKQTTYDLFSGNSESAVAEKYHTSDEQSIAEKMQKSNIKNIREAIGINEKFLFINELFNGDLGRYNKILDDINELTTKKGVDTYVMELKVQSQWDDTNEAFIRFKEIIDRKN